jgi:hypothetical protein
MGLAGSRKCPLALILGRQEASTVVSPSAIPTITEADALLAALRENPTRRAVVYIESRGGPDWEYCCAVGEFKDDDPHPFCAKCVALIADEGSAKAMLRRVLDADLSQNMTEWPALPLRYGPYCSTWVLPEHPRAPTKPGDTE